MELSEDWKSLFPVLGSATSPLLLSDSPTKSTLGPLFFNPIQQSLKVLYSSPSLLPTIFPNSPFSLSKFLLTSSPDSPVLPSTCSSIASLFGSHYQNEAAFTLLFNRLEVLKCPQLNKVIVFFPTGVNSEKVGFLVLHVNGSLLEVQLNHKGEIFTANSNGCSYRIFRISVNPIIEPFNFNLHDNSSGTAVGYLMVSKMYRVEWFSVQMHKGIFSSEEEPILVNLGNKFFKSAPVVRACWSPHLREESAVLLENGLLFLFELKPHLMDQPSDFVHQLMKFRLVRNLCSSSDKPVWLGCEFSWHPRILIVACTSAVFLVDLRLREHKVSCLMKIELMQICSPTLKEEFLAFSGAGWDGFHYAVASRSFLFVCDVRKPMMPVLEWNHGIDKPSYLHVFHLSTLRSHTRDTTSNLASESGICIILGSFWNCEFSLFCCGPSLAKGNNSSTLPKMFKPLYAWDLPFELSLSGNGFQHGSCLLREEILKNDFPEWVDWQQKKEIVLGFAVMSSDLSALLHEPNENDGFTLIRLMSSGSLEVQRYHASWNLVSERKVSNGRSLNLVSTPRKRALHWNNHLLYSFNDEEHKLCKEYMYLKFNYLNGYLNDNLDELLFGQLHSKAIYREKQFSLEAHETLCKKLQAGGFGHSRKSPATISAFHDVGLPATLHEVALRRTWADLPLELLQMSFCKNSEFLEHIDQKGLAIDFLEISDLPQLPPFFLRESSSRSNKWGGKGRPHEAIIGPVLPLPVSLVLHEFHNGSSNLESEDGKFSVKEELRYLYNEVVQVAGDIATSSSSSKHQGDAAVSLADDEEEEMFASPKPKPFIMHRPTALQSSAPDLIERDRIYNTLVSHVPEDRDNMLDVNTGGQEMFDYLCPIEFKYDSSPMEFGVKELKTYNLLKKQLSKWQTGFDPYKTFCRESKIKMPL